MPFVRRKGGQVLVVHSARRDGRVRQQVLARFASSDALARVLGAWEPWTEAMRWRHADLRWDFARLRERLGAEHDAWRDRTRGAKERRRRKLVRAVAELRGGLSELSPADPSDAALLEQAREDLVGLQQTLQRLLEVPDPAHSRRAEESPQRASEEEERMQTQRTQQRRAEDIFDQGMELWWKGEWGKACRHYRRAVALDPGHGDALNHLGIHAFERGRLKDAEGYYRAAIEAEEPKLSWQDDEAHWGRLENRPYLRALGNLALCHRRRRRWADALAVHQRMLRLNPNDNQGVRMLVGEELHRLGRLDEAIAAHAAALEFPECQFGLALARLAAGDAERAAFPLLQGMASNRYVAPMLLGQPWERLTERHLSSLAEPEAADAYVRQTQDLWRKTPGSARFLRAWYQASPVRAWRERLDELDRELEHTPVGERRSRLVSQRFAQADDLRVRELVEEVRSLH